MCNVCGSQITSPSFVGKKNSAFKGSYLKRAIFRGICLSVVSASISSLGIFNCLFCWIRLQGSVWDKYQERMTFLILWEHWGCCGREEWGWDGRAPLWFRLVPKENMKKRGENEEEATLPARIRVISCGVDWSRWRMFGSCNPILPSIHLHASINIHNGYKVVSVRRVIQKLKGAKTLDEKLFH